MAPLKEFAKSQFSDLWSASPLVFRVVKNIFRAASIQISELL
jgi:hypothetical protein